MLETVREKETRGRARAERETAPEEGVAYRTARRAANARKAAATPATDAQGLVEFACECTKSDCERSVRVPLYVYGRLVEAGDQYLLQTGHHAFSRYRTIVAFGLLSIEERIT